MLLDQLKRDLTAALKNGESLRVEALRYLLAAVQNTAIAKYGAQAATSLSDGDVLGVIKKQVKTHQESIDAFVRGNRQDLVDREKAQQVILEKYLPQQISDAELKELLAPLAVGGESNFGLLMKQAMALIKGKADGGRIAAILKQMLQKE